jgi:hypothetical protein
MLISCLIVSVWVGCSGLTGALGLGFSSAFNMSLRHDEMMSIDDAPGIGIFSGSQTSVSVVRTARVEGM